MRTEEAVSASIWLAKVGRLTRIAKINSETAIERAVRTVLRLLRNRFLKIRSVNCVMFPLRLPRWLQRDLWFGPTSRPSPSRQIHPCRDDKRCRRIAPSGFVSAQNVQLHEALDYGGLAVLNDTWRRFEVDGFLAAMGSPRQRGLLKAMIYARLLFPCAKLSLKAQAQGTWLAAACGLAPTETFAEDDLYQAMDQMNGHWVEMEKGLYQEAFSQGVRLALYDLTSTYFEGQGPQL